MSIALPGLVVAFAAFCVWLGVRIVNRRERWAKRTAWIAAAIAAYFAIGVTVPWLVDHGYLAAGYTGPYRLLYFPFVTERE